MNRLMLKHPNKDMYAFFLSKLYDKAIFMFYNSRKKVVTADYCGTEVVKGVYKEQVNDLPSEMKHEIFKWYFK